MKKSDPPIVIKASFDRSAEDLWNSLTLLPEMKNWYFDVLEAFEAREGFKTAFKVHSEDRTFTHLWEVIEVVPGEKITYRWEFEEYPGASTSTFEISGTNHQSELVLTVLVREDFPSGIPEFKRESCIGGWEYFLLGNLKKYLSA
ncbi:MAG: SRPBCC domain-containing protein [Muriicola sp.]|nr:SRPBCC domain-containing protein [Muriicola sp.]